MGGSILHSLPTKLQTLLPALAVTMLGKLAARVLLKDVQRRAAQIGEGIGGGMDLSLAGLSLANAVSVVHGSHALSQNTPGASALVRKTGLLEVKRM